MKDAEQCISVHPTLSEVEAKQAKASGGDASASKAPPMNETTQSALPLESNHPGTTSEVDELVIPKTQALQSKRDASDDDTDEQFFKTVVRCYSKMRA